MRKALSFAAFFSFFVIATICNIAIATTAMNDSDIPLRNNMSVALIWIALIVSLVVKRVDRSSIAAIFLSLFAKTMLSNAEWQIVHENGLPRTTYAAALGYWNGSFFIIGLCI